MTNNCILSATSLVGDTVKNAQGEKLGDVKDIMLCTSDNNIEYYVLSFGGIMGLGDKLFAIPPEAMQLDKQNECFVLNIKKELLEKAEGFDKSNWPNFADPTFKQSVYNYYGYENRAAA